MILVADDHAAVCRATELLLAFAGMEAKCVPGGFAALGRTETGTPGRVISDDPMPGITGLVVPRAIRRRYGDRVPVAMCSAGTDDLRQREAMSSGATT